MKGEDLKVNTLYYSRRFENFGMCLATADFMAYVLFAHNKGISGWYHCQELEKTFYDDETGKVWTKL